MKFITHRPLWVNIIAGILLAIGIFALILLSLGWLTGHGKSKMVPPVTGKKYEEARDILHKAGFSVDIMDSVYVDTVAPLTVIRQLPDADEIIKANRTVYLIVSRAVPPLIEMPNLIGYSYRNAEMLLRNMGLKVGDTIYKPDFASNSVLEQLYNGSHLKPGTQIRKGSVISLVLGDGVGEKDYVVPVITGMQFCEAKELLAQYGIGIASIVANANVTDTCGAWIYRQNPEKFDDEKRLLRIHTGQTMDVWLQVDKPAKKSSDDDKTFPEDDPAKTTPAKQDDRGY